MRLKWIYDPDVIHLSPAFILFPFPWGWSVQLSWIVWTVDVSFWRKFPETHMEGGES